MFIRPGIDANSGRSRNRRDLALLRDRGFFQQIVRYGFRRTRDSGILRLIELLRIQQQIIYPPPRLHSTWSPVFATTAPSALYSLSVLRSTNDVIPDAGQIPHSAASDQNYRVLLQIVPLAGDVCGDFDVVGETHPSYLSKR